jgi:hypothetical protein
MRGFGLAIMLVLGAVIGALPLNAYASEIPYPSAGIVNQQAYSLGI